MIRKIYISVDGICHIMLYFCDEIDTKIKTNINITNTNKYNNMQLTLKINHYNTKTVHI